MAVFTSAQDFFVSNSQSKKFELIKKPYVPRALRFSCQGPSRLREAKRAMGTRMNLTVQVRSQFFRKYIIFLITGGQANFESNDCQVVFVACLYRRLKENLLLITEKRLGLREIWYYHALEMCPEEQQLSFWQLSLLCI